MIRYRRSRAGASFCELESGFADGVDMYEPVGTRHASAGNACNEVRPLTPPPWSSSMVILAVSGPEMSIAAHVAGCRAHASAASLATLRLTNLWAPLRGPMALLR